MEELLVQGFHAYEEISEFVAWAIKSKGERLLKSTENWSWFDGDEWYELYFRFNWIIKWQNFNY